jgi:hypothetical protein
LYVKYSIWPLNISTFSNLGPSKIYPNWDFWFEKKPSGNPGPEMSFPPFFRRHVHTRQQTTSFFKSQHEDEIYGHFFLAFAGQKNAISF